MFTDAYDQNGLLDVQLDRRTGAKRMSRAPAALPPETAQRISREEMIELPIRRYEGSVHLRRRRQSSSARYRTSARKA